MRQTCMTKPTVLLFTQPDCPPCQVVKTFLAERGVAFREVDISAQAGAADELMQKYRSHSTPTLIVGEEVMIGFDPERLDEILGN